VSPVEVELFLSLIDRTDFVTLLDEARASRRNSRADVVPNGWPVWMGGRPNQSAQIGAKAARRRDEHRQEGRRPWCACAAAAKR
jgi:hypothetical protein